MVQTKNQAPLQINTLKSFEVKGRNGGKPKGLGGDLQKKICTLPLPNHALLTIPLLQLEEVKQLPKQGCLELANYSPWRQQDQSTPCPLLSQLQLYTEGWDARGSREMTLRSSRVGSS